MGKLTGITKSFFETQFFSPSFTQTKKQILTRLWGILGNPFFERMFAHQESRIDMFKPCRGGKVILVNTAKDLLKKEGSQILGRFVISLHGAPPFHEQLRAELVADERKARRQNPPQ